ncbi:hypothetical protein GF324_00570 [bacterium]|nr:hypothetical protein [bacterium]
MSDATVLTASAAGVRFAGRHPSLTRRIGGSADFTSRFTEADAEDRASHSIGRFRGITDEFPFDNDDYLDRWAADNFIPALSGWDNLVVKDEYGEAVDAVSRLNPYDRVYASPQSDVRDLIADQRQLRESYLSGDPGKGELQESKLAEFAVSQITNKLSEDEWLRHPDLARLALENRGGLGDLLREDEDLQAHLTLEPDEALLENARTRAREEVQSRLDNASDILTDDVFEENPQFALYLLMNPSEITLAEQSDDYADSLRAQAGELEGRALDELAAKADEAVTASPFTEQYFDDNLGLAEVVVTDTLAAGDHLFADYLNGTSGLLREDADPRTLASGYWAGVAKDKTGLNTTLFDNDSLSAMLAGRNDSVADALSSDADAIETSYPAEDGYPRRAYRAYGLGLGDRNYGDFFRWA